METSPQLPKYVRHLVFLSVIFLVASLVMSAFNAYTTFAAPLRSPFVPDKVGFEGQLANSAGQPVADGPYTITFRLYSVATGGTALWNETQSVNVSDGLYSVQLGSVNPLSPTEFQGERWLGVEVSGDSEMTPRIPISAVPFALNARQAMGLQGRDVATSAPADGDVLKWDETSDQWVPGGAEIPSGAILMMPGACPTGFVEYTAARGRYVVGVPVDGTIEAAVGTPLGNTENRPVGQHNHTLTDPGHAHNVKPGSDWSAGCSNCGNNGVSWGSANREYDTTAPLTVTAMTGITISNAGNVEGTNAPYIQLRFCQKP